MHFPHRLVAAMGSFFFDAALQGNAAGQKRPAEQSMNKGTRKRPVLGDITNPSSGERQQKASLPVKKPSLRVRKAPEKPSTNKAQCSDNSKEVLTSVKTEERFVYDLLFLVGCPRGLRAEL